MPDRSLTQEAAKGGRGRLLAAAAKLFAAKGYAATSVREILKAANVTAPVLYYHFGSKEGLFIGLIRQGFETLVAEEEKALAGATTTIDKVRAFCRARVAFDQHYPHVRWVAEEMLAGPPGAAPSFDLKGPVAKRIQWLADLVGAGVDEGAFRPCDPTAAALVLLGAVQMTWRLRLLQQHLPHPVTPPERVLETALDGLRALPRAAPAKRATRPRRSTGR